MNLLMSYGNEAHTSSLEFQCQERTIKKSGVDWHSVKKAFRSRVKVGLVDGVEECKG
jgi:hypothetical protein